MDALSQIKSILEAAEGTAQAKQKSNVESKRGETSMGSAPTHQKATEVLKGPGVSEADAAGNGGKRAVHPENDPKAKNTSHKGTGLKAEENEVENEDETLEEGGLPAFMKKGKKEDSEGSDDDSDDSDDNKKSEKGGDKMARLRALAAKKKGGKGKKDSEDDGDKDDKDDKKFMKKEEVDVTEHINALFSGDETLTEDFKSKAKTIFEAAIAEREIALREEISEEYEEAIVESMNETKAELALQLDSYLNYVVDQWMEENKLQVESGIKNEISESFLSGLRGLFLEHNIEVPESKVDLVAELSDRVNQLQDKLNEEIISNVELTEKLQESRKNEIIATVGEDLANTEFDKFAKLTESVSFEDEDAYTKKLEVIKASYFKGGKSTPAATAKKALLTEDSIDDSSVETTSDDSETLSESMKSYVEIASKIKPRNSGK